MFTYLLRNIARYLLSGLLLVTCVNIKAQGKPYYSLNANCQKAYNAIIALNFNEGSVYLYKEKANNPDNLIIPYLENYIDFLKVATNEDPQDIRHFSDNIDLRLSALKKGPQSSPYYLFCLGEVNMQWAICKLKAEEYISGTRAIYRAYNQLTENDKQFPAFIINKKSLCFLHAAIGTLPDSYKWIANMLGFHGTIAQGMDEIKTLKEYSDKEELIYDNEIHIIEAVLSFYFNNDKDKAWKVLNEPAFEVKHNLLNCFFKSYIAMKVAHNDEAINLTQNKPNTGFTFNYLTYMEGLAKIQKLDYNGASYINTFVQNCKGKNYLKDAYLHLAWCYKLTANEEMYTKTLNELHKHGGTFTDSDKYAENYATKKPTVNLPLLKARLLSDGMYFDKALTILNDENPTTFKTRVDLTEYNYRYGRIYFEMGQYDNAVPYLEKALEYGKELKEYFAANAALCLGLIYEQQLNKTKAESYFRQCIDLPNTEYKNSLSQKAKSGLNRIGKS